MRPGVNGTAGIARGLFDTGATGQHDEIRNRDSLAIGRSLIE